MAPGAGETSGGSGRTPGSLLVAVGLVLAVAVTPLVFSPAIYDNFTLPKQAVLLAAAAVVLAGLAWDGVLLPARRWLRWMLAAWAAALLLSLLLGIDWRGSLLGTYQYRQGFLTQAAYLVLFAGGVRVGREGGLRPVLLASIAGLAGTALYTAVQAAGNDPIDWWVDTSERAIGTIGNANELAAFAVIALAGCGAFAGAPPRVRIPACVAVAAAATFILFASESRSGLVAFVVVLAALPLAGVVTGLRLRAIAGQVGPVVAGTVCRLVLSALAGTLQDTAGRVEGAAPPAEAGGSTRVALWEGTLATFAASPLWGFGPDGLYLAFPRHRPDLGGAFADYDLVAQSSHNWPLDTAANEGLLGLAALTGLVGGAAWFAVAAQRREPGPTFPFVAAALAGYGALTLVNPISLAPHALFWVLLGALAGRGESVLARPAAGSPMPSLGRPVRLALAAPALAALVIVALTLPGADGHAQSGWDAYAGGDFARAARAYRSAHDLLPFDRRYAADEARALLAAGAAGDRQALALAEQRLLEFDRDFGLGAGEAIALATARIGLGAPRELIEADIDRALDLNPHGVSMASYTAQLREAVARGGTLVYSERDRWVFVEPVGTTP